MILSEFGDEKDYHLRKMDLYLDAALRAAKDGNKEGLGFYLNQAEIIASKEDSLLTNFFKRKTEIEEQLGNEKDFHTRATEAYINFATKAAKEGNKPDLHYGIQKAKKHAHLALYTGVGKRITNVYSIFYGTKSKGKRTNFCNYMDANDNKSRKKVKVIHEISDSDDDDELVVEGKLNLEQAISNRLEIATTKRRTNYNIIIRTYQSVHYLLVFVAVYAPTLFIQ